MFSGIRDCHILMIILSIHNATITPHDCMTGGSVCMLPHVDAGLVLRGFLVNISLSVVGLLVDFVADGITGSLCSCAEGGIAVLGDVLVGFLGGSGTSTLDRFGHVVGGVPLIRSVVTSERECAIRLT